MSKEYDEYLDQHRANVSKGFDWLCTNLSEIIPPSTVTWRKQIQFSHDDSKDDLEEYKAYDAYFYGGNRSKEVVDAFNKAWLRHIHLNPHHWQHWVLMHDDEPEEALEMPPQYVVEMICDWWAFSWKSGNLNEIFSWYEKHKDMKLHEKTRKLVEDILARMKEKLEAQKE